MIADRLRAAILQAAISGKLTDQHPEDGTATELLETIKTERQQLEKEGKIKKQKPLPPVDKTDEPFDLPDSWVWSRLGRVFNMQAGKNVAVGNISEVGEYPCYGGNGIRGYVADYNRDGTYPIIGRQGALCGNINVASGRFFATEHAVVVETFGHTSPAWAALALEQLNLNQYATATAQPGLSVEKLKVVPVPVPPVDEQERIVAKLDEVLPLIDQLAELEREREHLDREFAKAIERAILQAAISGKLTKQHPEDGTAEELLETIKTERHQLEKEGKIKKQKPLSPVYKADEPFELPGTWAYPALGEIVTLIRGITFPASAKHKESFTGAVRCLTTGSVQSRYSDSADVFVDASFVKRSDQYLSRGDAILSTANSTALVGKSIYWDEAHERTFGGFLTVARAMDSRPAATRYLHTVLRTLFLGGAFAEKSTQTTNIANLSNKILYGVRIPLPPAAEQERIVAKLDRVQPLVRSIEELVS